MLRKNWRVIGVGLLLVTTYVTARSTHLAPAGATERGATNAADDSQLRKLQQERLATLQARVEATKAAFATDSVTIYVLIEANQQLLGAELDLARTPTERLAVYEKMVKNARQLEDAVKALFDIAARGGEAEKYYDAKAARLAVEIAYERERINSPQTQPSDKPK